METLEIKEGEVKVRAPIKLVEQLKKDAKALGFEYAQYVRKLLSGQIATSESVKELTKALQDFFFLFESLVKDERIELNEENVVILKQIQGVVKKYE